METKQKSKTLPEVPILTTIFCFAVMMIHFLAPYCAEPQEASLVRSAIILLSRALIFVVPAFLWMSGLKLGTTYQDSLSVKEFYQKRMRKILLPYLLCFWVYALYYVWKGYYAIAFPKVVTDMILGDLVAHFYYVILAFQYYLLFPILAWLVKRYPKATIAISLVLGILLQCHQFFPYQDRFFGLYLFYFVFGIWMAGHWQTLKTQLLKNWYYVAIVWLGITACYEWLCYRQILCLQNVSILPLITMVYTMITILLVWLVGLQLSSSQKKMAWVVDLISHNSFGIYLYHVLLLQLIRWELLSEWPGLTVQQEFVITGILFFGGVFALCLIKKLLEKEK